MLLMLTLRDAMRFCRHAECFLMMPPFYAAMIRCLYGDTVQIACDAYAALRARCCARRAFCLLRAWPGCCASTLMPTDGYNGG